MELATERRRVDEWFEGDRRTPLVLERRPERDVCSVLFPTRWSDLKFYLRCTVASIATNIPSSTLKIFLYRLLGAKIGRNVSLMPGVLLDPFYPWLIEIEDDAFLGVYCRVLTHEYTARNFRAGRVHIGRGAVIGAWATVRSGVAIGAEATVGFNSLVTRDVPDGETVLGVPARPVRSSAGNA